jgi:hypothetical protein
MPDLVEADDVVLSEATLARGVIDEHLGEASGTMLRVSLLNDVAGYWGSDLSAPVDLGTDERRCGLPGAASLSPR